MNRSTEDALHSAQDSQEKRPVIFVDADACRQRVRNYLIQRIMRNTHGSTELVIVSDRMIRDIPNTANIQCIHVPSAPNAADTYITQKAVRGDLVITQDTELAEKLLRSGVYCISDVGEEFERESISARKQRARFNAELRSSMDTASQKKQGVREKARLEKKQHLRLTQYIHQWMQEKQQRSDVHPTEAEHRTSSRGTEPA